MCSRWTAQFPTQTPLVFSLKVGVSSSTATYAMCPFSPISSVIFAATLILLLQCRYKSITERIFLNCFEFHHDYFIFLCA